MSAANRSPLGFLPILLFHLCVLVAAVLAQNVYEPVFDRLRTPGGGGEGLGYAIGALVVGGMVVAALGILAYVQRRFLWDLLRGFKSAGVLLSLLVLACQLGTLIIQDLDLRRDGVFDPGIPADGSLPPFSSKNMATRFALAESHAWLWIFPSDERSRMYEEKLRLSPVQRAQIALRAEAFGGRSAKALEEAILAGTKRQVDQLTTSHFAKERQAGFYAFYRWCRNLHIFDIFEAWWFYVLLLLIAVNVTVGTVARAPWTVRDMGVAVTHMGILIILTGAFVDLCVAKEGYIWFTYGRPELQVESKIDDKKNEVYWQLPFRVTLDRFATEYYHETLVTRIDGSRRHDGSAWQEGETRGTPFSTSESFPVREGVPRVFEGGKVRMTVHRYQPRVFVETTVEEVAGGAPDPAIRLGIYRDPVGGTNLLLAANLRTWLFASDSSRSALDIPLRGGEVRIEYLHARNASEFASLTGRAPIPGNGWLIVRLGGEQQRVRVDLGERRRIAVGGRTITLEFHAIESALSGSENVNLDRRLQRSEEPVLFLRVDGRDASVPRDDTEFARGFEFLEGLELRFDWPDPRDRGVVDICRIVGRDDGSPVLVQRGSGGGDGGGEEPVAFEPGRGLPLGGLLRGLYLGVEKSVASGLERPTITDVSDEQFLAEGGGERDNLLAAWADVEISGPWGTVRRELTPFDAPIDYGRDASGWPLYRIALVKTEMARDWFSVLSIMDHAGNKVKTHAVQVNRPLRHNGYRFFQANAGKGEDGLGISGISVTRNPGVRFMYVGYSVLTLGVCWIFFFRPWYDRNARRKRAALAVAQKEQP